MRTSNYDKFPAVQISNSAADVTRGWPSIAQRILSLRDGARTVLAIETYPGVNDHELLAFVRDHLKPALLIEAKDAIKAEDDIRNMTQADVTDDPVFGRITKLNISDFFDYRAKQRLAARVDDQSSGLIVVYGTGTTQLCNADILIYADMARWEIQMRMRRNEVANLGLRNHTEMWSLQYKRAFFVDWRVADARKRELHNRIDFLLDTNVANDPKLITGNQFRAALQQVSRQPFRVVPFFDPAPWGGQWMKEVCDLDRHAANFGWCFDCVPEENSLLLGFGDVRVEVPSIGLVFAHPKELLGEAVFRRFGAEFPIRFDFLDTMAGGNLSFQVHPLADYAQKHFGLNYTQDESYYMLDAGDGASVYLGLREGVDATEMTTSLRDAASGGKAFDADRFANKFPAKKHDHFLIPAGTVHCSGAGSMVLEISATPYIFTFKLWDWGRLGLDGQPRPVHLDHGVANIQWDRTTEWVKTNLINVVSPVAAGDGWREERTGLHETEFIETRRHWFTKTVAHHTNGGVNVLNLVEGEQVVVESPTRAFAAFVVHYAETFIIPAAVGAYTIRPLGTPTGKEFATLKAFVRT